MLRVVRGSIRFDRPEPVVSVVPGVGGTLILLARVAQGAVVGTDGVPWLEAHRPLE